MTQTCSKPVKFKEGDGIIHGFSTGMVKVKSKFKTAKGNVLTSKINFLLDREWTEYMPIMVWVIAHPEGVFVVDTGENAQVSNQGYFKNEGFILEYINTHSFMFDVKPADEIGPQLKNLGYSENDINSVVLTHLHLDHFDGLKYFENTEIIINQIEWDHPGFALPSLYPEWFTPTTVQFQDNKNCHFRRSLPLVESGEIALVHTPGHTVGHSAVLIQTAEMNYLLSGDVTYDQYQLENDINAGGHQSFKSSKNTYRLIKEYANKHRLVYLPSHDRLSVNRLMKDEYLKIS